MSKPDLIKNLESELDKKQTIDHNLEEIENIILEINDSKKESLDLDTSDPNAFMMGKVGEEDAMPLDEVMTMAA